MISLALLKDLEEIDNLAVKTIQHMSKSDIPQWTLKYPRKEHYYKDVISNALYIYKEDGVILGAMTILPENDPPYKTIDGWLKEKSLVIHRVIVDPENSKKGIAQKLLNYAFELGKTMEYESIKIDTHLENYKMRNFLHKNGFVEIGYLACINRQAYEKVLGEES